MQRNNWLAEDSLKVNVDITTVKLKPIGLLSLTSVTWKAELSQIWCSNWDIILPLLIFSVSDAH